MLSNCIYTSKQNSSFRIYLNISIYTCAYCTSEAFITVKFIFISQIYFICSMKLPCHVNYFHYSISNFTSSKQQVAYITKVLLKANNNTNFQSSIAMHLINYICNIDVLIDVVIE